MRVLSFDGCLLPAVCQVGISPLPDIQESVPVIATGLFAGVAAKSTASGSDADLDAQHKREHFKVTYKRTAPVQVPALKTSVCSIQA